MSRLAAVGTHGPRRFFFRFCFFLGFLFFLATLPSAGLEDEARGEVSFGNAVSESSAVRGRRSARPMAWIIWNWHTRMTAFGYTLQSSELEPTRARTPYLF